MDIQNIDEIQAFLDESVKDSCEGLMVKMLTGEGSSYEPSKRSMNWLKVCAPIPSFSHFPIKLSWCSRRTNVCWQIKKDYLAGVGDSVDLVVVGAFHGRGKRKSTYGAYLLACYNPETQEYQTICKIGTGFSDEVLDSHTKALKPYIITAKKSYILFPSISTHFRTLLVIPRTLVDLFEGTTVTLRSGNNRTYGLNRNSCGKCCVRI